MSLGLTKYEADTIPPPLKPNTRQLKGLRATFSCHRLLGYRSILNIPLTPVIKMIHKAGYPECGIHKKVLSDNCPAYIQVKLNAVWERQHKKPFSVVIEHQN